MAKAVLGDDTQDVRRGLTGAGRPNSRVASSRAGSLHSSLLGLLCRVTPGFLNGSWILPLLVIQEGDSKAEATGAFMP